MKLDTVTYMLETEFIRKLVCSKMYIPLASIVPNSAKFGISAVSFAHLLTCPCGISFHTFSSRRLHQLIDKTSLIQFNEIAAKKYADLIQNKSQWQSELNHIDLMVAAHAICENLILITEQPEKFQHIPGLSTETWIISELSYTAYKLTAT
ncbi:hypothetical protein [Teredinibacter sp. KSP-S5-2]|uniref:type II toxin-antitoxin system VapC family toxin n=1 Tax=Teredinibacter sp. KSP-S5-2 TaxID=3034506 RepID=UPI0029340E69|nr:hypothetical protein [Teredinibacter sp. KSP-S5-2]WNO10424.1 hypothetical protein P5V12_04495 [Teredinibacter sp. KSP-S5-2]